MGWDRTEGWEISYSINFHLRGSSNFSRNWKSWLLHLFCLVMQLNPSQTKVFNINLCQCISPISNQYLLGVPKHEYSCIKCTVIEDLWTSQCLKPICTRFKVSNLDLHKCIIFAQLVWFSICQHMVLDSTIQSLKSWFIQVYRSYLLVHTVHTNTTWHRY